MPIWLRNLTFNKLKSYYESQNKSQDDIVKENIQTLKSASPLIKNSKTPTYVTKAIKK